MFAEFECGRCEARMQIDAEDNDTSVWSLVWRFANNHTNANCGGMFTTGTSNEVQPSVKSVRRRIKKDGDEEATV